MSNRHIATLEQTITELRHAKKRLEARVDYLAAKLNDARADVISAAISAHDGEQECRTWRWLHWSHPDASWACRCGHAHGAHKDGTPGHCEDCGMDEPRKRITTLPIIAAGPPNPDTP